MKKVIGALLVLGLAGCGEEPAPPAQPAPAAPAEAPPPAAAPAPAPEAKAPEEPKPDPDKELAERVKNSLEGESKIQAAGIDVTAAEGKVTLWGTAASAEERSRAAKAASRVQGVKSVENKIAIVKGS